MKKQLKPAYRNYFSKVQSRSDDQDSLENACKSRGGVWNRDDQLCYGLKEGRKNQLRKKTNVCTEI